MAAIEVIIKPITSEKTISSLKKALSQSSVNQEAIVKAKENLKTVYGFNLK